MSNEEFHERTVLALARAACSPFITEADLDLLAYHCGLSKSDISGVKVTGYSLVEMAKKANDRKAQEVSVIAHQIDEA